MLFFPLMQSSVKKSSWISKIGTKEDALKAIKHLSIFFVVVGLLKVASVFYYVNTPKETIIPTIIEGSIYIILVLLLLKFKSRIIAIFFLLISLATLILNFIIIGIKFLPIGTVLMAFASIRLIQATLKYNQEK